VIPAVSPAIRICWGRATPDTTRADVQVYGSAELCPFAITKLHSVKLFAALSAPEADQAERGALRGDFVWVDDPHPEEAAVDAVWVSIDVPDNRMARFERRSDQRLGYREFLLPSRITNLHRAQRVQPPE
jgi:hypothetical protein